MHFYDYRDAGNYDDSCDGYSDLSCSGNDDSNAAYVVPLMTGLMMMMMIAVMLAVMMMVTMIAG